jgi:hypothetical protein
MPVTTRPPLATPAAESHTLAPDPIDVQDGTHDLGYGHDIPCKDVAQLDRLVLALRQWHDDSHPGAWRFCPEQPCDVTKRITGGVGG